MLLELLTKDRIKINHNISNWEMAGKLAGEILVNTGDIEYRYVEAMIESVKEFGPYIVVAPGIALFHARPEDGVNNLGIGLVVFKEGVVFGANENDPVNLVFILAATDNKSHTKLLGEIASLLQSRDTVEQIINSNNESEILSIIENNL